MFIQSNSYQLKSMDNDIFTKRKSHEFPVSFVKLAGSQMIYASRNELFSTEKGDTRKIGTLNSDITFLSVEEELVCCGTTGGSVYVFSDYRKCLRSYGEHSAAVTGVKIANCPDMGKVVISCSDDSTVKLYKLLEDASFKSFDFGGEYVRAIDILEHSLFVGTATGLTKISVISGDMQLLHACDSQVSQICILNRDMVAFAYKNRISVINITNGAIVTRVAHSKRVVNLLAYDGALYSAAGNYLKTWGYTLKAIGSFSFDGEINDFDIANDSPVVALASGDIYGISQERAKRQPAPKLPVRAAYDDDIDIDIVQPSKKRLSEIDYLFQRYKYKDCIRLIVEKQDVSWAYTVLQRLQELRALKKALADENAEFLENFLNLCIDYFSIKEFNGILIECLVIITTIYSELILDNEAIREQIDVIREEINEEVAFQEICLKCVAFLDCFPENKE